jgi:UDP-N-acetyl-D-glucosamine dehydrogenase
MRKTAIIGQGYVGLPLAIGLAGSKGQDLILGFDVSETTVKNLNEGLSHIDDISDAEVKKAITEGYRATSNPADIALVDTAVICVPTPLNDSGEPDLSFVVSAVESIAGNMSPKTLVILESTTYPGTTEDLVRPILERGGRVLDQDFYLAFSPERIDPGNKTYKITNTPKIVGGSSEESTRRALAFYEQFVDTVVSAVGTREAETAKLLENTYRHVNIALINEMAIFCNDLGIDIWEVVRLASSKPYGFAPFYPGPGVGGHCIPVDSNYLSFEVQRRLGRPFRFVEMATDINTGMPAYVVNRVQDILNDLSKTLRGSNVLLLGMSYKPDIKDMRESPSVEVAKILIGKGADTRFYDPHVDAVKEHGIELQSEENLDTALEAADVVVLLQNHAAYDLNSIVARSKVIFDTRGVLRAPNVVRL